ncbi:MAG: hypothetical protein EOO89_20180 [Pedobacter sp.]|nr:MAG: hypothetical protein EOO89_20180 [Pedobacter sp.]
MKRLIRTSGLLAIAAGMIISSCNTGTHKELTSGIILKNMDTTVAPGNNFSQYVNGTWMKNTRIPSDKASYGAGYIVHEKSQEAVKAIIENSAKTKGKDGSEEQKIGDLYNSYMDMKTRDSVGISPLKGEFSKINAIKTYTDLAAYFGYTNKRGFSSPLSIFVEVDFKDPKKYMLATWQGGLGLPDREYYSLTDATSVSIRAKYLQHIENMLKLGGIADPKTKASQIMALETMIASKQMKKEDTRNMVALYNPFATKDLKKLMPDFDWTAMFKEAGINHDSLVVTQVDFTKALNGIIKNTPIESWKTYLTWHAITNSSNSLTTALDNENFNFYSKTLNGVKEQQPRWRRGVDKVSGSLGEMIGKVYVEKNFPPEAKERMLKLVKNLLKAYESSIKELAWMGAETKKQALDKLNKFTPKIGYPDKWIDYSSLKITGKDLYGNNQGLIRSREVTHIASASKTISAVTLVSSIMSCKMLAVTTSVFSS